MNYKSVLIFVAILTSCANQVPQLEANLPLVEHSFVPSYDYLPEILSKQLDRSPPSIEIKGKHLEVGEQYFSASGKSCVRLKSDHVIAQNRYSFTVCKGNLGGRWHYAESLL